MRCIPGRHRGETLAGCSDGKSGESEVSRGVHKGTHILPCSQLVAIDDSIYHLEWRARRRHDSIA